MPAFLSAAIPLFTVELLEALQACGVDNLDTYPVEMTDPHSPEIIKRYRAVNIIGLISAADMARSKAVVHAGGPLIDVSFDKLVIDPAKTGAAKFFRLAEATGTLVVHESVRDFLVARGFDDLVFHDPGNVAI